MTYFLKSMTHHQKEKGH